MKYIEVKKYSYKRMCDFLEKNKDVSYNFVFNIMSFKNKETLQNYFKPEYIIKLLSPLYKDRPIVIEVSEFFTDNHTDRYGIKYVITGFSSNIYPNIQIKYYVKNQININCYSIRKMNTDIASHIIYHEHLVLDSGVVLNDFEILGFKKAVRLMSLCESCKFYDDESYYMKCAVHPELSHDIVFICRDYDHSESFVFI